MKRKTNESLKQFVFNSDKIADIIKQQSEGFSLPRHMNPWFKNQIGVRKTGCVYEWTKHEESEFIKCALDIHYFANNYCKIKSEDGQVKQMKLRDYQYKVLDAYTKNRFTLNMSSRQTGKTVTAAITLLHFCIFNTNKGCMIVANKAETVIEIIDKIKNIYKLLPFFLKPGIINWNNRSIVFDNGCRIKSQARSKEPAIGFTIDFLYMDEFAHIPPTIISHYYKAAVPTVSSIKGSKIVITSTPNGANLFKDLVLGSQFPDGHPEKNRYTLIKVYWYQVPDGVFADGTNGTRLDAKLYFKDKELKEYKLTREKLLAKIEKLGYKCVIESVSTDTGEKYFIRVLHIQNNKKTDLEYIRSLKVDDININKLFNITNWQEEETLLIGGEEAFNQEYGLQFVAGSKRVLSASKAKELEDRCIKYKYRDIELLNKKLKFDYDNLRWHPDFIEQDRHKYFWIPILDVSEGLGQDDSVINLFRLEVRDEKWLQENKLRNVYDAFYLKQTAIYNFNLLDAEKEFPELFYALFFEYFNPEYVKSIIEYNGPGSTFLAGLPSVYDSNNQYGNYIFVRYKHKIEDTKKKVGIKVTKTKKELVKKYISVIENDKLYVDEELTLSQMDNFVKLETRGGSYTYKADSGHDDIVMTNVIGSTFFDTQDFKSMCDVYYNDIPSHLQKLIDQALDLDYNPDAISYKSLSNVLSKKNKISRSNRYSNGQGKYIRK